MFTQNELEVILILLSRVNITGGEAANVAVLMQKIRDLIKTKELPKPENKPEQKDK